MSTRLVRYCEDSIPWLALVGPRITREDNIIVTLERKNKSVDPDHLKSASDYVTEFGLHIVTSFMAQVPDVKDITIDSSTHRPHDRIGLGVDSHNHAAITATIQVLWACLDWPTDNGTWWIDPAADAHQLLRLQAQLRTQDRTST